MNEYIFFGPLRLFLGFFCITLIIQIYMVFSFNKKQSLNESILKMMHLIGDSSKMGESIETSVKKISEMKKEPASKIFKKILLKIEDGMSFTESVKNISKKEKIIILDYLVPILIASEESGSDIYDTMNNYSTKLNQLLYYEKYAHNSLRGMFVLKVIAVFVLPLVFIFFPYVLEDVVFDNFIFLFLTMISFCLGFINYVLYDDFFGSINEAILLGSMTYLFPYFVNIIISSLGPYVSIFGGII